MSERPKEEDTQRDKMERPEPGLQPVEGDLETVEADLEEREKKERSLGQGG